MQTLGSFHEDEVPSFDECDLVNPLVFEFLSSSNPTGNQTDVDGCRSVTQHKKDRPVWDGPR